MENNTNTPKKTTTRDKYNQLVKSFIHKLENNDIEPWTKSWSMNTSLPKNFETENSYQGINILTLLDKGFKDSRFLTFNQIKKLGGKVKKGEKSTPIFFMKPIEKHIENEDTKEQEIERYFLMQSYNVFNIEQTEEIDYQQEVKSTNHEHSIQQWINSFDIETYRGSPAYSPKDDCIFMPHYDDFINDDEYYSTYFHEMSHYTGHSSRLDRFEKHTVYGDERYAFEELIAELGSAFLSMEHNIKPNSKKQSAYLQHWITALQERPQILYSAASHASKSTNYLIDRANDIQKLQSPIQTEKINIKLEPNKRVPQIDNKTKNKTYSPQAS